MILHLFLKRTVLKLQLRSTHIKARYDYCQLKFFYHHLATYLYLNNLHNFRT